MKKKRFSVEQIVRVLMQGGAGARDCGGLCLEGEESAELPMTAFFRRSRNRPAEAGLGKSGERITVLVL